MGVIHPPSFSEAPTAYRGPASADAFWRIHAKLSIMATPAAHPPKALDDRELARLAVAGDGNAFAELYDRHEQRVYGFCMRMLGTQHDAADATQETFVRLLGRLPALEGRDLNFVAYALATARNACYDMIEGRRKAEPMAEQPEPLGPQEGDLERDPERAALLAAAREDVQAANAALPPRQREVLALREVELLSYDEIGELMGLNRNAVAQLVSRARIKLRDLMRDSALVSVSASSADCARALPLLASIQDDQRGSAAELEWVHAHIAGCDTCRLSRAAMEEAGVSYRALAAPIVPLVWLRHAAIARAAEFVGADWSGVVAGPGSGAGGPGSGSSGSPSGAYGSVGQAAEEQSGRPGQLVARSGAGVWAWTGRGRLAWTLLAGALLALCIVLVAMVGGTRDGHVLLHPTATGAATAHPIATAIRRPYHRTTSVAVAKHGVSGFHNPANTDTALAVSTAGTPHHSTDRVRSGGRRRHRTPATHRPAPAKPTPKPPPATTPAATTPTTTTPVAPPPPPATTPTTPPPPTTTPTTTTPPARTTPEPAPPGGSLIP